jgi:hypothetical protein
MDILQTTVGWLVRSLISSLIETLSVCAMKESVRVPSWNRIDCNVWTENEAIILTKIL